LTLAAGHNIVSTSASVALSSTTPSSTNDNFYSVSNNTIPTLAVTAANPTYTENGSAVDLFSGVTAATNDLAQTFTDMTLTVTNVSNGSSEVLNIGGTAVALNNGNSGTITGIGSYSVSVSGGTATVVLSGMTRSDAQMGTLIDGITYSNLSDNPGSSNRVVTITGITDSGTSNNSATPDLAATVSVSAVNDAPSIAGLQTDATVIEDTASNVDLSAVTLTDVDSGSNSITLTIAAAAGTLAATSGGSVTVGGSGSGTLTLTGTVANIDTYLNTASNIKYTGASNAHGDNATTLTLTANDGGNSGSGGGGNVSLGTVNVDITAVNDAPVIANLNGDASSVETGSGIVAIDAGGDMTIADIDSADFNGGSLTITQSGGTANGNFSVNGTTITSGSDGVIAAGETIAVGSTAIGTVHATNDGQVGHSLQIDFNTDATPALIQTLIHGLEYAAPSGLGVRAFTLTLNDGDGTANGGDADAAANFTIDITGTPQITSATYDAVTGTLVVTGVDINAKAGAANDIDASAFTLTGEGGATYTLTNTYDVERTSETQFTLTLSAADHAAVNQILNKDGTISTGGTTFNLAAADDWNTQVTDGDTSDATNGVMVSNVVTPTITGATYDSDTGVLVVNGNGFLKLNGVANDIDVSKLTFTGEGGDYTLSDSLADVEITSATSFSVTLTGTDKAQVDAKLDQIGASSTGGTTYNLAAAEDWAAGADAAIVVADTTGNGITVAIAPKITSATYNATTGVLAVTGTNIHADAGMDIDASQFTLTGEGGATYTLTNTADMERTSVTEFSLTLSATDQAAVNQMLNKAGTISTGGTTFNLAAADDWNTNVTDGNTADATNAVTVSNVPAPTITSAAYDAATNALVVTGANFVSASGANNDIVANKLTFTG
ncbi:MAG: hypothetical protein VB032_07575, partial [Burkholderiaceae bacterium]|nr:hypothetical protein [Burkholderiaceae bacterium]